MISTENINAVIFDLDNTLADRKYAFFKHAEKCAEDFLADRKLKEQFTARLIELDCNGYRPKKEVYETICGEFPLNCTVKEITDSWNTNADRFIKPEPYAEEILEYLKEKYTLALLTNGHTLTQNIKLEKVGLRKYFKAVVISEETGTAKPDPEIFFMICRCINTAPENCVYIGDNFQNDIKGALSAGMKAVLYDRYKQSEENYTPTVFRLEELKLLL